MKLLAVALALSAMCVSASAQSSNLEGANLRLDAAAYQLKVEKGTANGYAPLDATSLVPPVNIFPGFTGAQEGTIWVKSGVTFAPVQGSGISSSVSGTSLTLGNLIIGDIGLNTIRGMAVTSGASPLLLKAGSSSQVFVEYGQTFGGADNTRTDFAWKVSSTGTFKFKDGTFGGPVNFQGNNAINIGQASNTNLTIDFPNKTISSPGNITFAPGAGTGGLIIPPISAGGTAVSPTWALNTNSGSIIFGRKDQPNTWVQPQTYTFPGPGPALVVPDATFTTAKVTGLDAALADRLKLSGGSVMAADLNMGGFKIVGLVNSSAPVPGEAVSLALGDTRYASSSNVVNSIAVTAPLAASGPAGGVTLSMPVATASNNGYLASADWAIFNAKEGAMSFGPPTILTRSGSSIVLLEASPTQSGYMNSTDYVALRDITTGYSAGQVPIGLSNGKFTKGVIGGSNWIDVVAGSGTVTVSLKDAGFTNGQMLIGDSTAGGLRKGTILAGAGITITPGAASITISATSSGGGTAPSGNAGITGVLLSGYQLDPADAAPPSAVGDAYTATGVLTPESVANGKFFRVVVHGRIKATAAGDKFRFFLYYKTGDATPVYGTMAGPVEYPSASAETDEPFTMIFESTIRSVTSGSALVLTYSQFVAPKNSAGGRATAATIGRADSIGTLPDANLSLVVRVQTSSIDGTPTSNPGPIINDHIIVDQAYIQSN